MLRVRKGDALVSDIFGAINALEADVNSVQVKVDAQLRNFDNSVAQLQKAMDRLILGAQGGIVVKDREIPAKEAFCLHCGSRDIGAN